MLDGYVMQLTKQEYEDVKGAGPPFNDGLYIVQPFEDFYLEGIVRVTNNTSDILYIQII